MDADERAQEFPDDDPIEDTLDGLGASTPELAKEIAEFLGVPKGTKLTND
jgi:hypothetical protein